MISGLPVRQKLNDGNGDRRNKQDVYKTTLPHGEFKYCPNDQQNSDCWPHRTGPDIRQKGLVLDTSWVRVRQQKAVHGSHGLHEIAFGIITPYVDASGSVCGELRRFVQFVTDASDGENVSGILRIGF